ncbi:MAG: response regulator transcription factor [Muribaculaceae bacterium]|nr:response regulator transcription factor [Muribaculaceae bacterium]
MNTKRRILVVDDEDTLCDTLAFNLEAEGYTTDTAYSAEEALTLDLQSYDLILLDIMMGEISGIQLAKIIRSNPATASVPLIFCTAKDSDDDVVAGLELGADDYISKPYSLRTLIARVRTVLRRTAFRRQTAEPSCLSVEGLCIFPADKSCSIDGKKLILPRKEFELLLHMMKKPGHIFSRQELLDSIWPDDTVVLDRVVDVNITRLRQKLGNYGKYIITRTGYGYGFAHN